MLLLGATEGVYYPRAGGVASARQTHTYPSEGYPGRRIRGALRIKPLCQDSKEHLQPPTLTSTTGRLARGGNQAEASARLRVQVNEPI